MIRIVEMPLNIAGKQKKVIACASGGLKVKELFCRLCTGI